MRAVFDGAHGLALKVENNEESFQRHIFEFPGASRLPGHEHELFVELTLGRTFEVNIIAFLFIDLDTSYDLTGT